MMIQQVRTAQGVTRLSPTAAYNYACQALAGTGPMDFQNFRRHVNIYLEQLRQLVANEDKSMGRLVSRRSVTFDEVPKFHNQKIPLVDMANSAMWNIMILVILNIIFFMTSYAFFIKSDV